MILSIQILSFMSIKIQDARTTYLVVIIYFHSCLILNISRYLYLQIPCPSLPHARSPNTEASLPSSPRCCRPTSTGSCTPHTYMPPHKASQPQSKHSTPSNNNSSCMSTHPSAAFAVSAVFATELF